MAEVFDSALHSVLWRWDLVHMWDSYKLILVKAVNYGGDVTS